MYFNYTTLYPHNGWERRSFWNDWWRLYADDAQAAPPAYHALGRFVRNAAHPWHERMATQLLAMHALPQRTAAPSFNANAPLTSAMTFEEPVAAAMLQLDGRRQDGAAYLGLLRCANDEETLERLLAKAFEVAAEQGAAHLLGPTGVLPAWQPGVLMSHFNRLPPWHTPYNPPYVGDLLAAVMEPWLETRLFEFAIPAALPPAPQPALIEPLPLARLSTHLLPLLTEAADLGAAFPACDDLEAQTLLQWLGSTLSPLAWLATVDAVPVGLIMLQPDLAPLLQRSGGGRGLVGRAWLALGKGRRVAAGRLLLGAVLPGWRGRGIGLQLWRHALQAAAAAGWQRLTCGPLPPASPAAAFLTRRGATAAQHYVTFKWSPW